MAQSRRLAPLVCAVVALAALVAAFLAWRLVGDDSSSGSRTFTGQETAAVEAAQTEAANLLSFRRAHFDADVKRALAGATGSVVTDIKRRTADVKKLITAGKFDLVAKVTHAALVGRVDDDKVTGYVVLVSLNGYRSDQLTNPTAQQNLSVTVVQQSGRWLVNQVDSIGVTS
ncbi:hypothetical protein SAMN05443575_1250 [Jatrophihabitans endophyticus]|uniref:Mce-associated membrane protein n=1 Tax=Jatrophihabitans endophyticus TaxID=1206085 RepID=A0A1M5GQ45_9ACTN|nr:hypothetical protein [Jatrophihabitans endophyticus]SHG05768.1 hypothetical protein SAMN05443575_1250 [Jatrophihabitans endophyticus]